MRALVGVVAAWSAGQRGLRVVALLGPVVALLAAAAADKPAPWWLLLLVVALAIGFALAPDGPGGAVALVVVVGWWTTVPGDGLGPAVLLAAVALLSAHVAALLAAYGPGEALVAPVLLRLWTVRGAVALLAAPVLWLVAEAVRDQPSPAGMWSAGMVAALLAVLAGSVALVGRDGRDGRG